MRNSQNVVYKLSLFRGCFYGLRLESVMAANVASHHVCWHTGVACQNTELAVNKKTTSIGNSYWTVAENMPSSSFFDVEYIYGFVMLGGL